MAADKQITALVQVVSEDKKTFKILMGEGQDQWFRIGGKAFGCPERGMTIRITYNVSPGNEQYPSPTFWCNTWQDTDSPASGTPTSEPNPYEAKAQELEAVEQAQSAAPANIRRFETNESISMAVCIKAVTEGLLGNLAAAVSHPDVDSMSMTVTPESIAENAEALYQAVFVAGPPQPRVPGEGVAPPDVGPDGDPGPDHE